MEVVRTVVTGGVRLEISWQFVWLDLLTPCNCMCPIYGWNCMCWFVHSAIVPSSNVRPIDTSVQSLGVKRTSGFVRACGELARHRELLARPASNSDDSSDEHNRLDVATSRHKVNTWLVFQPCSLIVRLMLNLRHQFHWLQPVMLLSPCSLSLKTNPKVYGLESDLRIKCCITVLVTAFCLSPSLQMQFATWYTYARLMTFSTIW